MKRKTTIYVDDVVLRALKVAAARSGQHDYEVVEQALRAYLGMELIERATTKNSIGEREATTLAYRELHRVRKFVLPK